MTDVVFAYPDFESLGVGYLMSACRAAGFQAALVRYEAEDPYTARRTAYDPEEVAARMAALQPGVAAFSCVTHNFRHQLACARAFKRLRPDVPVLFGGVHPTAVPHRVLAHPEVDAVAIGEAERSLVALLARARGPGGAYRLPDGPIPGFARRGPDGAPTAAAEGPLADLDALPPPEKVAFHPDRRRLADEYFTMASRGCPFRCAYCFNSCIPRLRGRGGAVRRRTVEGVVGELEAARRAHGIRAVHFLDDSFTADRGWLEAFAPAYRARVGLPFLCSANPELVDERTAAALRQAGCVEVQLGVQTLSPALARDVLDRHLDPAAIERAVAALRAAGILVQTDYLLGIPGDTLEAQEAALAFLDRLRPGIVSVFWLAWYPGTAMTGRALAEGWLTADQVDRVERGEPISEGGLHAPPPGPAAARFLGVAALLNWLPLLPRGAVAALLRLGVHRWLRPRSYLLTTALPRVLRSLLDRRYFTGRAHLRRALRRRPGGITAG